MVKIIDPANGWQYGFPKPIPEDVRDVKQWLVENGYPKEEIELLGENFMYSCWYEGDED